jgi:predicted metal-dependent peptidase
VVGGGGTDLRPVFEPQFLRAHRPDALVYFTDGYGPCREEAPQVRTLWVLTCGNHDFDCAWGRRTVLNWAD